MPRLGFAYSPGNAATPRFGVASAWATTCSTTTSAPCHVHRKLGLPLTVRKCVTPFLTNGGIPPEVISGISVLINLTTD